jgi:hypothetical protein
MLQRSLATFHHQPANLGQDKTKLKVAGNQGGVRVLNRQNNPEKNKKENQATPSVP